MRSEPYDEEELDRYIEALREEYDVPISGILFMCDVEEIVCKEVGDSPSTFWRRYRSVLEAKEHGRKRKMRLRQVARFIQRLRFEEIPDPSRVKST